MNAATSLSVLETHHRLHTPKPKSIKTLAESPGLAYIPPNYTFTKDPNECAASEPEDSIPIIDFASLTSGDPDQCSQVIQDLGKACQDWGFFMVVNHGVAESLMKAMIDACGGFFNLREEEKRQFEGKSDPIWYGTSFNSNVDQKLFCWRDFLKAFVHPQFHFPNKPTGFSDLSREYCKQTQRVVRELLKGISKSLGLEECYIEKAMDLESGLQVFATSLYPPCPQPELTMGLPQHSDHGLLTLLIQNEIGGLQLQHNGKWVNVNPLPNSFLVNTADHLEILSNGRYKSVVHRVVVNNKATRISIAMANGPSLDTIVSPALELIEECEKGYIPMKYKDYLELQLNNQLDGKSSLDRVRIQVL